MEREKLSGPSGTLILGNVQEFISSPVEFFKKVASYGDIGAFRLGPYRAFLMRKAEDIHDILVKQGDLFSRDPIMKYASSKYTGTGIINSEGSFHRDQRRLMQPAFHQKRLDLYVEVMLKFTDQMLEQWKTSPEIVINSEMTAVTLKIVCDALFKADIGRHVDNVVEAVTAFEEVLAYELRHPFPIPDWVPIERKRRLNKSVSTLKNIITEMVQARRKADQDFGDVLSTLVFSNYDDGSHMSDRQILYEMMTMLIAGHETSSSVVTWMLYILSQHPDIEDNIVKELDSVLAGRAPQVADLPKLTYMDSVIKETLRMYPPGWLIGRSPISKAVIGGHTFKKGDLMYISPYITHRDPRNFDDPDTFKPERWLDGLEARLPKGAYVPFSNGYHICIGQQFALMEIKVIMARVLQRFHCIRLDNDPIEMRALATLRMDRDMLMKPVEREYVPSDNLVTA